MKIVYAKGTKRAKIKFDFTMFAVVIPYETNHLTLNAFLLTRRRRRTREEKRMKMRDVNE